MRADAFRSLLTPYICPTCVRSLRNQRRRPFATAVNSSPDIYDVVCVGGGPAGLSLLTALRASPITSTLKLALVELQDLEPPRKWKPPPSQFSNRASSLTPSSESFFSSIGAWEHIDHARTQPYNEMQVWDGVTSSRIEFDWASTAVSSSSSNGIIATMTENSNITHALLTRLSSLDPISLFAPTTISSLFTVPSPPSPSSLDLSSYPHLTLSSHPSPIVARLLVGADGLNSPVRTFANIPSRGWDYNRHGVVATVKLAESTQQDINNAQSVAYQRFLPTGPIALLPLPGGYATLVWSTLPQHASLLRSLPSKDLAAMIDAGFRLSPVDLTYLHTLPSGQADEVRWREDHTPFFASKVPRTIASVQEGSVASFPLRLRHADTYIAHRIALVGDAAHTIHPLAGQGLNQGQADVAALVRTIEYAVTHGADIGAEMSLEMYNSERWATNDRLLGVVDKLHKLYSVGSGPVVGVRGLGLEVVNQMGWLKGFFMKAASGA